MKQLAHVKPACRIRLIDPQECARVLELVKQIPEHFWYQRKSLQVGRGMDGATCDYGWITQRSMPKHLSDEMIRLAPKVDGLELDDWVINRYMPGQYMGRHRDRDPIPYNAVIPLQSLGDGIKIEDTFYPDEVGVGAVFFGPTPVHEVPPVVNERYVLVYLLTEK